MRLFRRLPQSRRFVPEDPKQLAVFEIEPVAISLVDYASGFGTSYLFKTIATCVACARTIRATTCSQPVT